jgi:hypothetical protein
MAKPFGTISSWFENRDVASLAGLLVDYVLSDGPEAAKRIQSFHAQALCDWDQKGFWQHGQFHCKCICKDITPLAVCFDHFTVNSASLDLSQIEAHIVNILDTIVGSVRSMSQRRRQTGRLRIWSN